MIHSMNQKEAIAGKYTIAKSLMFRDRTCRDNRLNVSKYAQSLAGGVTDKWRCRSLERAQLTEIERGLFRELLGVLAVCWHDVR